MAIFKEKRPKQVYREGYKPGSRMVSKHLLPERLPHMQEAFTIDAMEVMAAGLLDDGREFQEVRVYVREAPASPVRHNPERPIPLVPEVDRG
jgi:hypothetical protein